MKVPIEHTPEQNLDPVETRPAAEVLFVQGAIRAARNVPLRHRKKVIRDLSLALACSEDELMFLFGEEDTPDTAEIYDFPDSERRRKVLRYNKLDAAE